MGTDVGSTEILRRFSAFRRALRAAEGIDDVAQVGTAFATRELGFTGFVVYCAERDDADFQRVGDGELETIERANEIAQRLATDPVSRDGSKLRIALRSPSSLIGFVIAEGPPIEDAILEELAFDIETALAARIMTKLRAEELAVLEIQERELVGLLRDVQERDAIIQKDLDEARQFQEKMLGPSPRVPGVAIEVVYKPLGVVGGDLYAVSKSGNRLRLFIADATGHGVRASLTTMFIKSGYEAVTRTTERPAALLEALNDSIARTYRSAEMLFSAACVDLDLESGHVELATAAHPPICIVRGGKGELIEGGGAFLGLRPRIKFDTHEAHVARGDGIYLFTDGFSEACDANGEQFGDDRLVATIVKAHESGERAGAALNIAAAAFANGGALADDATFLGVRFGVEEDSPPISGRMISDVP
jgi:serine phosphatase RsbU (regulator of sigma subunit)